MFKRDILVNLRSWASSPYRKPLILRGARQVGKTTVVKQLSEEYENFLSVNLEKTEAAQLFNSTDDVKQLVSLLFLYCNVSPKAGRTLLFLDEVQASVRAVSMLRYFYEEMPELHVIAAGSLLETMLDTHISLPVGRVEYLAMHPCSFTEFLNAIGEGRFVNWIKEAQTSDAFHDKLMLHFSIYALIGGMPEAVARYAETGNVLGLSPVYNQLLNAYKNDVEKYAKSNSQATVIRYILDEGWTFAGQRITLGGFASSLYKARENGDAFRILERALLLELVYPTTSLSLPVVSDLKKSPKLIWLDAGLVNYAANIQKEYLLSKNLNDVWRGNAAEQIVAQELKSLSTDVGAKLRYWVRNKRGSTSEVDFIFIHQGMVIPIEVKSGHNSRLKSLHQLMSEAPHDIAIRVWSGKFSVDSVKTQSGKVFRLVNLPFYMIAALPTIVERLAENQG